MARIPRREIIDETRPGFYHCTQRCVRRAFLCGEDRFSGKNYDHRKEWIRGRLEFLAGQFAIDVVGYSVLDNHCHVILRNRPDVARGWSDEEVARRYWNLFPKRKEGDKPAVPTDRELAMLMADPEKLAEKRRRLSSISWLMRCLAENIARRANKEDGCTGRFWEGRYDCVALLDESAILVCNIYVDLNPIRAGIAPTPEESRFTSIYDRIHARTLLPSDGQAGESTGTGSTADADAAVRTGDHWLSPLYLDPQFDEAEAPAVGRASNKGFLSLQFEEYLALVDWTGRQARPGKRGQIPGNLQPILERLQVSEEFWLDTVTHFGQRFHRVAGRQESLAREAARRGRLWFAGIRHSRKAFV